jgi:hypothetical protein
MAMRTQQMAKDNIDYLLLMLSGAVRRGDFAAAAEYERRLGEAGVIVRFGELTPKGHQPAREVAS